VNRASRVAALGAGLILAAGAFGVSALYVPGAALVLIALAARLIVGLAAGRARVTLELGAESVEEGFPAPLLIHAKGWPFALSCAELRPLPGGEWQAVPFSGLDQELRLSPARRGGHEIGPAVVRFADPFGICMRERSSETARLLVLPRVHRVPRRQLELTLGLGRTRRLLDDGPDVEGLRPYRQGAPASRIHWLTVARVGRLVERRAERDAEDMPVTVVLDASFPDSAEALDSAVRAAASLCVGLAAHGGCALLLPGSEEAQPVRPDLGSWPYLHARLAHLQAGPGPSWGAVARARSVIWVGARRPDSERRGAGLISCTVSSLPRGDRPVLFAVAGCSVQSALVAAASAA
jgi:uncharacterized protein (DUF58 family)